MNKLPVPTTKKIDYERCWLHLRAYVEAAHNFSKLAPTPGKQPDSDQVTELLNSIEMLYMFSVKGTPHA